VRAQGGRTPGPASHRAAGDELAAKRGGRAAREPAAAPDWPPLKLQALAGEQRWRPRSSQRWGMASVALESPHGGGDAGVG